MAVPKTLVVMIAKVLLAVKVFGHVFRRSTQILKAIDLPVLTSLENVKALTKKLPLLEQS
jgi:hypothetical protein